MTEMSLRLGTERVPYVVRRSNRRTLAISVEPAGEVIVRAPHETSAQVIERGLRRRASWILKARRDFERLRPRTPNRRYLPGETHRFLGRQYRLAIEADRPVGVALDHDYLRVGGISPAEPDRVRNRLENWYQHEARRVLSERVDYLWSAFAAGDARPRLIIQTMEKRWGSLASSGRSLVLNRRLIEADIASIDFVIVHELCHLSHRDHGSDFFALLGSRMPDWAERKARLEKWML